MPSNGISQESARHCSIMRAANSSDSRGSWTCVPPITAERRGGAIPRSGSSGQGRVDRTHRVRAVSRERGSNPSALPAPSSSPGHHTAPRRLMSETTSFRYRAFISYSHAADGRLGPALPSALRSHAETLEPAPRDAGVHRQGEPYGQPSLVVDDSGGARHLRVFHSSGVAGLREIDLGPTGSCALDRAGTRRTITHRPDRGSAGLG